MKTLDRNSTYLIGNTKFEVIYADITAVPTDAIVSSDDNYISMGGGVSQSIRHKAGEAIREELKKHLPMKIGDVAATSAGHLDAKYIFHGITIDYEKWLFADEDVVKSIVEKALGLAENLGLKSISFPALGTGVAGFPFQLAAKTMTNSISNYLQKDSKLEQVNLCLFARESTEEADLNTFYEQAVGLASIAAQNNRLDLLLMEVKEILLKKGSRNLIKEVESLQSKITDTNTEIALHTSDNNLPMTENGKETALGGLSTGVKDFSYREQKSFADRDLELSLLRTRVEGLYTVLNIKQHHLNAHEIEEAKYGGQMIPPRLTFAIKELKEEMNAVNLEIEKIRARRNELMA